MPRFTFSICALLILTFAGVAADNDTKQRAKAVRELGKGSSNTIQQIEPYLSDREVDVRLEAVKAITQIGTQRSLDPLIKATSDNDPEVQIRAIDGLVNFYVPGYVKTGISSTIQRAGHAVKGRFTDTNDQIIDPYIQVRPGIITALGRLVRNGAGMDVRADAARALGILRGRGAISDLEAALRSKDSQVMYESLIALQKIRDQSAGPSVRFLLRDLDEKVQAAAIETEGLLQDRGALSDLRLALDHARNARIKRLALTAMAQVPDQEVHGLFISYLDNKDEGMREAAEGLGRLRDPGDQPTLEKAFTNEGKSGPRLALAFALVQYGNLDMSEFAPLRYLVNELNSSSNRGVAKAYLTELARDPANRGALYTALQGPVVTKAEKTGLAQIFAAAGDRDSVPYLETLSKDPDNDVAQEGLRALRNLNAKL